MNFRFTAILMSIVVLSACQPEKMKEPEFLGLNCQLKGDVISSKGVNLSVNSCVSYAGYTQEEVKQACATDVEKWHDFAKSKGKVELTMSHPETCPIAVAKCTSIESVDANFKVTQSKVLYHYDSSSKQIEARRKGCETRRGEFSLLNTQQ